jgi:hypothetical protein
MPPEGLRALANARRVDVEAWMDAQMADSDVRAVEGAASMLVAAIEVEHDDRRWTVPIESPCGAFIVGIEGKGPATLRAIGHDGRPLADADGATERTA